MMSFNTELVIAMLASGERFISSPEVQEALQVLLLLLLFISMSE